jgi:hypothetical protein
MAEVTNAKAAVFNLFNIGSALLNAMTLCLLKQLENLSDERVVLQFKRNPYFLALARFLTWRK